MGRGFRWLVGSNWVANLGDGIALAAGPLLVASQTHSPFLVALAALLQRLPWLIFGLYAGVLADRLNRRLLVVTTDLIRVAVVGCLGVSILTGWVNIAVVLVAMFLIGVAEVFADSATGTLLPMLVDKQDLGIGNARLLSGYLTMNQMVGPPVGAALFAVGMASPFAAQAVCGLAAVSMISRIQLPESNRTKTPIRARKDILEGLRFTWNNPPIRTLTLATMGFNVMLGAAMAVLVLYATQRLGTGPVGFGLLTTAIAVGGIVGTGCYDWLERKVSMALILRAGLVIETSVHLGFALTRWPWFAMVLMFVLGAHSFIWSTASRAVRMRAVPLGFQGRVGSLYLVGAFGTMAIGQLIGGVVASVWGVAAPFWIAFTGCLLILVPIWRQLAVVGRADDEALKSASAS